LNFRCRSTAKERGYAFRRKAAEIAAAKAEAEVKVQKGDANNAAVRLSFGAASLEGFQ